jgi:hypothetical protein
MSAAGPGGNVGGERGQGLSKRALIAQQKTVRPEPVEGLPFLLNVKRRKAL